MFRKLLIANRGEIAVRLIRGCRELNVAPVRVCPEAHAAPLHVRLADETSLLSPAPPVESYLRIARIVRPARTTAAELGYPIMLKAAAGGGGKGMRLVSSEDELASAFEAAQSEAASAFGDSSVYLEKAVERPRHIEIQIFADAHGNYIHLGERECSIQRRHQKVIEECPSPINDADLRAQMGAAALRVARAANYVGAGTVEFLVSDVTRQFYFLEMNTRLQVEHPVTELVTGIDL